MGKGRKPHSGMKKRFKVSKNGKVRGAKGGYHHNNIHLRTKQVRQARKGMTVKGRKRIHYRNWLKS